MIGLRTRRPILMWPLLACAVSCTSPTAQVDGGATARYTKIDDMEEGPAIEWMPPSGLLPGTWYSGSDCSGTGDLWPPPPTVTGGTLKPGIWSYSDLPAPHETFSGILSTRAARLRTTSPINGQFAVMAILFARQPGLTFELAPTAASDAGAPMPDASSDGPASCPVILGDEGSVDLSTYSGVTFWAKGDPTGVRTIQVKLQDVHTDPRGGFCNDADSTNPDACYNGFSTTIALTSSFAQYTIDFLSLQQDPRWGYRPHPDALDAQHVYQLAFEIFPPACYLNEMCVGGSPPPVSFDFWIDDVYFVNK
jgi:hypothetical protein